jgi:hypothetical protein
MAPLGDTMMKKTFLLAAVVATALFVGCSPSAKVSVVWKGTTPATAAAKDVRAIDFKCPACGTAVTPGAQQCSIKECRSKIQWPDEFACGYCAGTGDCPTCKMMNQTDGKCYNCAGSGTMALGSIGSVPIGKTAACPNCKQTGKCPTCSKSSPGKCDFCKGDKKVSQAELAKHMAEKKTE